MSIEDEVRRALQPLIDQGLVDTVQSSRLRDTTGCLVRVLTQRPRSW
jgi:hypothetical protein